MPVHAYTASPSSAADHSLPEWHIPPPTMPHVSPCRGRRFGLPASVCRPWLLCLPRRGCRPWLPCPGRLLPCCLLPCLLAAMMGPSFRRLPPRPAAQPPHPPLLASCRRHPTSGCHATGCCCCRPSPTCLPPRPAAPRPAAPRPPLLARLRLVVSAASCRCRRHPTFGRQATGRCRRHPTFGHQATGEPPLPPFHVAATSLRPLAAVAALVPTSVGTAPGAAHSISAAREGV